MQDAPDPVSAVPEETKQQAYQIVITLLQGGADRYGLWSFACVGVAVGLTQPFKLFIQGYVRAKLHQTTRPWWYAGALLSFPVLPATMFMAAVGALEATLFSAGEGALVGIGLGAISSGLFKFVLKPLGLGLRARFGGKKAGDLEQTSNDLTLEPFAVEDVRKALEDEEHKGTVSIVPPSKAGAVSDPADRTTDPIKHAGDKDPPK